MDARDYQERQLVVKHLRFYPTRETYNARENHSIPVKIGVSSDSLNAELWSLPPSEGLATLFRRLYVDRELRL